MSLSAKMTRLPSRDMEAGRLALRPGAGWLARPQRSSAASASCVPLLPLLLGALHSLPGHSANAY